MTKQASDEKAGLNLFPEVAEYPVNQWHPDIVRDESFYIDKDGQWFYRGMPLQRKKMVRLFSRLLRREGECFYLVTPSEKHKIRVEDVPFAIVAMECTGQDRSQNIHFITNVGDRFALDHNHPLRIRLQSDPVHPRKNPVPYVTVRDLLEAKINRNVYYELTHLVTSYQGRAGIWSFGGFWALDDSC